MQIKQTFPKMIQGGAGGGRGPVSGMCHCPTSAGFKLPRCPLPGNGTVARPACDLPFPARLRERRAFSWASVPTYQHQQLPRGRAVPGREDTPRWPSPRPSPPPRPRPPPQTPAQAPAPRPDPRPVPCPGPDNTWPSGPKPLCHDNTEFPSSSLSQSPHFWCVSLSLPYGVPLTIVPLIITFCFPATTFCSSSILPFDCFISTFFLDP